MDCIDFIFAGKSYFTVKNERSGQEESYLVEWKTKYLSYIVSHMNKRTGELNGLGYYNTRKGFIAWRRNRSVDVFEWFLSKIFSNTLPSIVSITSFNRCGRCGRKLKDHEAWFGDDCLALVQSDPPSIFEHD